MIWQYVCEFQINNNTSEGTDCLEKFMTNRKEIHNIIRYQKNLHEYQN